MKRTAENAEQFVSESYEKIQEALNGGDPVVGVTADGGVLVVVTFVNEYPPDQLDALVADFERLAAAVKAAVGLARGQEVPDDLGQTEVVARPAGN